MFDVEGLRLPLAHPSCVFADGGGLKSMLALYCAGRLEERGIHVLFNDWEFAEADHRERFGRMFPTMPDLLYRRCERPLTVEADAIRRIVRAEKVDFAIFDSVVFACDGPPESAETAAAYFRAARALGIGGLHVAHINKSETGDKKPFGSSFWHNGFRSTWFMERAEESPDGRHVTVGAFHRKSNIGPLHPATGFEFYFDDTETTVKRVDIANTDDFAGRVPTWQKMIGALKRGPMTLVSLAEELDSKMETIKKVVDRSKGRTFTRVEGPDGIVRIGLVDRRPS
jgi:hypothetical protein